MWKIRCFVFYLVQLEDNERTMRKCEKNAKVKKKNKVMAT